MIEEEVFKRRTIDFNKVKSFGFSEENDSFLYSHSLSCGMRAEIRISSAGTVKGRLIDEDLGEEYVLFRQEGIEGAFVNAVKNEYTSLLEEIAAAISTERHYAGAQANRISERIGAIYGVSPEFLWERFPHYGVYRHPESGKWFGIIMNIGKNKVHPSLSGEGEVMNLKTDDMTSHFIGEGVYPSYHMNHNSWISVILDDTLSDEKLLEMIAISYVNVGKKKGKKTR